MCTVFAFVFMFSSSVFAAAITDATADQPVCFGREYSEAHMNKNTLQTVKKMTLKFSKDDVGGGYMMNIDAQIKKTEFVTLDDGTQETNVLYKPYTSGMYCQVDGKTSLNCFIDCDGGTAAVSWEVATAKNEITFTNKGFQLYGGCGEDELDSSNWIWLDPAKGGDDVFKMYALPSQYCQK